MKKYLFPLLVVVSVLLFIDWYFFQAVQVAVVCCSSSTQLLISYIYWAGSAVIYTSLTAYLLIKVPIVLKPFFRIIQILFTLNLAVKLFGAVCFLLHDIIRSSIWLLAKYDIFRLEIAFPTQSLFFVQVTLGAASIVVLMLLYGMICNAHNFQIKHEKIVLPNLPPAFNGLKIGHISDLHIGGMPNKRVLEKAIKLLLREKPDLVFFTGDLVDHRTGEAAPYVKTLKKIKAPLGVYSVLGNHDYGDYVAWDSLLDKNNNNQAMIALQKELGWDLLRNENRILEKDGEKIAVLGVENWGSVLFAQYGRLAEAYKGTGDSPVKLLLSHDPSHWEAEVTKEYPEVDITFSGHTHGGQLGLEIGSWKWSMIKYRYKQWAGLYKEGKQYLYVNRGLGCSQLYLGRLGILPEITIVELVRM